MFDALGWHSSIVVRCRHYAIYQIVDVPRHQRKDVENVVLVGQDGEVRQVGIVNRSASTWILNE